MRSRDSGTDLAVSPTARPGLEVARAGGPGELVVVLRGTDSDQTTVLIDGVRINPGTLGRTAAEHSTRVDRAHRDRQGCPFQPLRD